MSIYWVQIFLIIVLNAVLIYLNVYMCMWLTMFHLVTTGATCILIAQIACLKPDNYVVFNGRMSVQESYQSRCIISVILKNRLCCFFAFPSSDIVLISNVHRMSFIHYYGKTYHIDLINFFAETLQRKQCVRTSSSLTYWHRNYVLLLICNWQIAVWNTLLLT